MAREVTAKASILVVVCITAACEARLDVLTAQAGVAPLDAGAHGARHVDASMHLDASTPIHDARPPPHDVTPPKMDVVVGPDHAVTDLRAGEQDTCAVAGGTLYCWGMRSDGVTTLLPERVPGSAAGVFIHVSPGTSSHCATRTSGTVFCFGTNDRGELGQGDRMARLSPARVSLPGSTSNIAGKWASFCSRLDDGQLECWGQNDEGQMGQSDDTGTPQDALIPVRVGTTSDFTDVDTGQGHVCAIRSPGNLYCWGRNTNGELGLGDGVPVQLRTPTQVPGASDWTSVVAGQGHTCGLRGGRLFCFGDASFGQLGTGSRTSTNTPVPVGDATDFRQVSTNTFHTCAIRGAGTLWCWGRNAEGQLGLGDTNDREVPTQVGDGTGWAAVSVGRFHTCARRADGTAWCTGANDAGRLGTGDLDRRNVMTPVVWSSG